MDAGISGDRASETRVAPWPSRTVLLGGAVVILALLLNGTAFYNATRTLTDRERSIDQTQQVLVAIDAALATMVDAETGQRGYIITGNTHYLQPYDRAVHTIAPQLDALQRATADSPVQQQRVRRVRTLAADKLTELARTIALRRVGRTAQAIGIVLTDRGKALMDALRAVLASMKEAELTLLRQRAMRADAAVSTTTLTIVLATAIDVVLLAGLLFTIQRALVRRAQRAAEREQMFHRELAARAEAVERMDAFLSLASHELKTPLTVVNGNLQLVERRLIYDTAERERRATELATQVMPLLGRAHQNLGRLNRLVDDLLDMSRIHAGPLDLRLEPCDLAAVVREVVHDQQQLHPARAIHLDLPDNVIVPVRADAARIGQVVVNYLTNALKYAPPERPIIVGVHLEEPAVARVDVRDQGPGLSATDQEHIWERFYRAAGIAHQSGSQIGLGLGLYISRTIIERHKGHVGVESRPGAGATFWFTLPLVPEDAAG